MLVILQMSYLITIDPHRPVASTIGPLRGAAAPARVDKAFYERCRGTSKAYPGAWL
jgi:hypothetical protein